MGLEPTSGTARRPCSRRAPDPAGWLPSFGQFRGQGSNLRPPGSEPGVTTSSNCPGIGVACCLFRHPRSSSGSGGGKTRTSTVRVKAGGPAVSRTPRVPCGCRTRLSGVGGRCLAGSAKGTVASTRCGDRTRVAWLEARGPAAERPRILTAEGVGLEPTRLIARPRSRRVPSRQVGLPFPQPTRSTGGRNRTCELLLNREAHEPAHATPVCGELSQSGRPDSNWRSPGPEPGGLPGFPTPRRLKCPAGVEPALPPWQGGRLPLHHGHNCRRRIVKEEHRVGLEPTSPPYEGGILAAGRPVLRSTEWDQRGSNPHLPG